MISHLSLITYHLSLITVVIGIDGNEANVKNRVGSGQYAFELLHQFAKNTKHQFLIYLKDKPLSDLPIESTNFKYKVIGPKRLWTQLALPFRLTFGQKPDIFFSMAHYGPRFSKVPYVVTIHDLSYLHYPEMFKKNDLYQLTSWSKYSIKNSSHIIAVSKITKNDIAKNYHVNPSKITVTYEGYDEGRFKPQSKSKVEGVKSKYRIKGDYIIFVGTLQPRKNIERLIEAFASIVHSSQSTVHSNKKSVNREPITDNLLLVIVGKKGWLYDSIFAKVKSLDLDKKVIFTDYVPGEDLPALISGAKVYVLPSLWEGFGIPVIEVQACRVPVVVSNTSSLPEIVTRPSAILSDSEGSRNSIAEFTLERSEGLQNDKTIIYGSAVLINPENVKSIAAGIKKALDPKTRSDLVEKGFENIKRFSWEKCAKETLQVLEKVAFS